MRREHAFYSDWCRLFDFHLRRLNWPAAAFALKVGRSQQAIHSYLSGRARPPLDQVPIWAAMLGLHGEERERFLTSAQEAHVPVVTWRRLSELEHQATTAKRQSASPSALRDELTLCRGVVAELVGLLSEVEALFFTRTVQIDRVAQVRAHLQTATRRAIERYARPGTVRLP